MVIAEIVADDFAAGGESAFGLRIVGERGGILKGGEDGGGIVVEAALGGIGGGEIEERSAGGAEFVEGDGEAIAGERPVGAVGEHGEWLLVVSFWFEADSLQPAANSLQARSRN